MRGEGAKMVPAIALLQVYRMNGMAIRQMPWTTGFCLEYNSNRLVAEEEQRKNIERKRLIMPATRRSQALVYFWRVHRWIYRLSDGRIGSTVFGNKMLKLTTKGRRSGKPRAILLYYFTPQENPVVIASNAGSDRHPAWYLNLQSDPDVDVQIGSRKFRAAARIALADEREKLWSETGAQEGSYNEYQKRTKRQIPVVILEPVGEG